MWLLITFIIVWAMSPGPVAALTINESRKNDLMAGIAISGGATITSALMVLGGIALHLGGFSRLMESGTQFMSIIEAIGAIGIIMIGMYTGYKSLLNDSDDATAEDVSKSTRMGLVQGMMMMATYIPQALVFYSVIIPQTVGAQNVLMTIIMLGTLKVFLIFFTHAGIAYVATSSQNWMANRRVTKLMEISIACLIIGLGINLLV